METNNTKRTIRQNSALHKYFSDLALTLNEAGLDLRVVLKPSVEISWTPQNVKEYLWKPFQKALLQKESTTELNKQKDIDLIWENLNRHLVEKFGSITTFPQFPSLDEQSFIQKYNEIV